MSWLWLAINKRFWLEVVAFQFKFSFQLKFSILLLQWKHSASSQAWPMAPAFQDLPFHTWTLTSFLPQLLLLRDRTLVFSGASSRLEVAASGTHWIACVWSFASSLSIHGLLILTHPSQSGSSSEFCLLLSSSVYLWTFQYWTLWTFLISPSYSVRASTVHSAGFVCGGFCSL